MAIKRETREELNARVRAMMTSDQESRRVLNSPELHRAIELLKDKQMRRFYGTEELEFDLAIAQLAVRANREPDVAETMTGSERKKLAKQLQDSVEGLRDGLKPFVGPEEYGFKWPIQPYFDRLALEVSLDDAERWKTDGEDAGVIEHRTRYAIYHLLMRRMDWVLDAIGEAARHFATTNTVIKKPRDANARRLFFLRNITQQLNREFGSPCRAAAIELASIFFDCSDLDEATVSKLAPVVKPEPIEVSEDEYAALVAGLEKAVEYYASTPEADPDGLIEMRAELNKLKEMRGNAQPNKYGD